MTAGSLTERTNGSNHTQGLSVAPGLHILGHFEHLARELGGNTTCCFGDLKAAENITLGIGKGLALLEGDGCSKSVPVGTDQAHELEHDLLLGNNAGSAPGWEGLLGRLDGGTEFLIGALRHASNEVVGGRIVQVDPGGGLGSNKLVVQEIGGVDGVGDGAMVRRVLGGGSSRGGSCGGELLGSGVESTCC